MALREGIVVGDVRAAVGLGDAQIGEQKGHGLGGHGGPPVGVEGELAGDDLVLGTGFGDELAGQFIAETCAKHQIVPGQLTLHPDRGSPMTSKPVAFLLADLGVTKTHSRPHVSDDNPFSESHFKTLKYRPEFPARFGSLQHPRSFCQEFFSWYNTEHHHSGLGLLTPEVFHSHRAEQVRDLRQHTLDIAYAAHPERFVRKPPQPPALPTAVWINPPPKPESGPPDSEETVQ